jgi:hypothetical protein
MKLLALSTLLAATLGAPTSDAATTGMITYISNQGDGCLTTFTVKGSTSRVVGTAHEMSMKEMTPHGLGVARIISETNQNYRIEIKMPPSQDENNFAMIGSLAIFLGDVDKNFAPGTWTAHVQFVDQSGKPMSMKPSKVLNFPTGIPSAALYSHDSKILQKAYSLTMC